MTTFTNLKQLEKILNKKIANSMKNEVSKQARNTMKEKVVETVYQDYSPTSYERTGGLYQDSNIETKMLDDNTLVVRNIREEDDRDIAYIVEYGDGYSNPALDDFIGARPYHEDTLIELEKKGLAKNALKKGLQRQGIDVK